MSLAAEQVLYLAETSINLVRFSLGAKLSWWASSGCRGFDRGGQNIRNVYGDREEVIVTSKK